MTEFCKYCGVIVAKVGSIYISDMKILKPDGVKCESSPHDHHFAKGA